MYKPVLGNKVNHHKANLTGCIASWRFNERSGLITKDTARNFPAVFDATNPPVWDYEGVNFNGDYKHIDGPVLNQILPANSSGSILLGYRAITLPTYGYLFSTSSYANFSWFIQSGGAIRVLIQTAIFDLNVANYYLGKVLGFSWKVDGANITVTWYKDGLKVGFVAAAASFPNSTNVFQIGGRGDNTARYAGGVIKWFDIYNKVLSDKQFADLSDPNWLYERTPIWMFDYTASGGGAAVPFGGLYGKALSGSLGGRGV